MDSLSEIYIVSVEFQFVLRQVLVEVKVCCCFLIVFPPSQFIAQSPVLNQTVIDKCCKFQVVKVSESTNKKSVTKHVCLIQVCSADRFSNCFIYSLTTSGQSDLQSFTINVIWFKDLDISVCRMTSNQSFSVVCFWLNYFLKECSRCHKTAHGWVF